VFVGIVVPRQRCHDATGINETHSPRGTTMSFSSARSHAQTASSHATSNQPYALAQLAQAVAELARAMQQLEQKVNELVNRR
jgi:hypothetical protein